MRDGRLSAGHARTLVTHEDPEMAAKAIIEAGMNVREAEALTRRPEPQQRPVRPEPPQKDADTRALEKRVSDALGLAVEIRHQADGKGEVRLRYGSLEQLDHIVARLMGRPG